jgi:RNA exonuclease 1
LIATKLYEAFARIYGAIMPSAPTIATEHAKEQEERILEGTTNLAGYKQMATTTLMHLKKRPVSTSTSDVGLDGDWVDPQVAAAAKASLLEKANECIVPVDVLRQLEYPLPDLLNNEESAPIEMVGTIHACDRCSKDYLIKNVLEKSDLDACIYHPMRIRMIKVDGQKVKVYGCCEDPLGSVGCTRGPHVYKDADLRVLHQKTPYVQTPKKDAHNPKKRLVALDCEMGYTTAGMELIRFTAVDQDMQILLDELVLPSNMIIDLNTQYSGIKTLEGVKYDLDGVRKEFFKHVDEDTIIVGHGLENDMNAMRIIHTKIIDTVAVSFGVIIFFLKKR